jgi:hypothetical protein
MTTHHEEVTARLAVDAEADRIIGFIWQRAIDIETEHGDTPVTAELRDLAISIAGNAHHKL